MAWEPWRVDEGLWERLAPLLPVRERRFRYPGRLPLEPRRCLEGILYVLFSGLPWAAVPSELGVSGITCWRRHQEWQQAGVWQRLHELLLAELHAAGEIEWSRAIADSSHVQAKKGAPKPVLARSTGAAAAASSISS